VQQQYVNQHRPASAKQQSRCQQRQSQQQQLQLQLLLVVLHQLRPLRKFTVNQRQPYRKCTKKTSRRTMMNLMRSKSCRRCWPGNAADSRHYNRLLLLLLPLLQPLGQVEWVTVLLA
jgi:hypothetical protein